MVVGKVIVADLSTHPHVMPRLKARARRRDKVSDLPNVPLLAGQSRIS